MISLLWSIINVVLVLYFLYLLVGFIVIGNRIFSSRFKNVSFLIMIVGIVNVVTASNSEKNTNRITITDEYNKMNDSEIKKVTLEDNLTFDINMLVKYSVERNEFIPVESNSFLTGFISGYVWEFKSIQTTNYKPNEETQFTAHGILKWNLFGINIYSQSKTFNGIIE